MTTASSRQPPENVLERKGIDVVGGGFVGRRGVKLAAELRIDLALVDS